MPNPVETLAERLLGWIPVAEPVDWTHTLAARWQIGRLGGRFVQHGELDAISLDDLLSVDRQKHALERNTQAFLAGFPANNALLWGARGTGKSSLIHGLLARYAPSGLRLLEVDKTALEALPEIADRLAGLPQRFILFCDDLSFDAGDASYKSLKSALEGSVFRGSGNLLVYATSNRRHLLPEHHQDNAETRLVDGELHEGEAVEEKISLSDRFGLWLSFYALKQDDYLSVVAHWVQKLSQAAGRTPGELEEGQLTERCQLAALAWARARGVRSGRTAEYFARDWVGGALLEARDRA